MLDVFRFAWFAVRTFFGVVALVLSLYAALWLFVKILSAAPGNGDAPQMGGLRTNSPSLSIHENPTPALARKREYKATHFVDREFDRPGN